MASGIQLKSRNVANQTFHVTGHGVGDLKPFFSEVDKREFIARFKYYLGSTIYADSSNRPYEKLNDEVVLLAFKILDNHFHLVIHQFVVNGMRRLMTRVLTSYGRYYNIKYKRRGPILDGRHAADPIDTAEHAKFAIAYTHLNDPIAQLDGTACSHPLLITPNTPDWLDAKRSLAIFGGVDGYRNFINAVGPRIVSTKLVRHGLDPAQHPYRPFTLSIDHPR